MASTENLAVTANSTFQAPNPAVEMIAFGLVILAAHLGGKLCRRFRLSEVTGQLLGGALVGPYALHLIGVLPGAGGGLYDDAMHAFHFFIFVFLSVVAFAIGEELHVNRLRKVGGAAVTICLIQGFMTWLLISSAFIFFSDLSFVESMLVGSIGIATAPAVTFVLMNQLRIEGRLRHILGSIVVLDDMIEVIVFSLLLQVSLRQASGATGGVFIPVVKEVVCALLLGGLIFLFLRLLVRRKARSLESEHEAIVAQQEEAFLQRILAEHPSPSVEILLIVMGVVSIGAGFAYFSHWPFLITATFAGFMIANFHSQAIFDSLKIDNIAPALNILFFALIGANISLSELHGSTAVLAALYILTRLTGKVFGTWVGCKIMREERKITACLLSLMLPQAGVAAVEAVYVGAVLGSPRITAIILPAIVFFEVVGVFWVDRGLNKWRSWVAGEEEEMKRKSSSSRGPAEAARRILAYLTPECIQLGLKGTTKKAVIEELVDWAMSFSDQHIDRTQALQVLGERERLAATGFGNGIAIPHCRLMGLDKSILVFGRHEQGVEFGGVDNTPCDLFLMMLTPARDPGEHLRLLSSAAHILGDEGIRERLRMAGTHEEFLDVIQDLAQSSFV